MSGAAHNYDIIGDIHGHADELRNLLHSLGYKKTSDGHHYHPERKVIFVGDFIDRGSQQKEVIHIVRAMVENGSALAVMGNHEFNALSYHSNHPETGMPLRPHTPDKTNQHRAFLDVYSDEDEKRDVLNWFKTLPLFLELDGLRVIHACWNESAIAAIENELTDLNCLTEEFLVSANEKGSAHFEAVETLLKGIEMKLPQDHFFTDNYGKIRENIRIRWWQSDNDTYKSLAIVPDYKNTIKNIPDIDAPLGPLGDFRYKESEKPVFFGHYWFTGLPEIQQNNVVCLDYSVAKQGKLTAYRWNQGDTRVYNHRFHQ